MVVAERARMRFGEIKRKFLRSTDVSPTRRSWQAISHNEIWECVVSQVVVVGRADPSTTLRENPQLLKRIAFSRLVRLSQGERRKAIHSVLRDIGARYCSRDPTECRKTAALLTNFETLHSHPGGPRGFLRDLMTIRGAEAVKERVDFVTTHLCYIKNKGARDFLTTGLRVADQYLAFDVRWQNVLTKIGVRIPKGTFNSPTKYAQLETALMTQVARPLRISGKQLDQLVFNNYSAIMQMEWGH